jgi:hypothetical protein
VTLTLTRITRAPSPPHARAAASATGLLTEQGRRVPVEQPRHDTDSAPAPLDIVEEWGVQSFPASDPPANW